MNDLASFNNVQPCSTLLIIDTLKKWMIYHCSSMFNIVQHCWSLTHIENEWSIIVQECSTLFNSVHHQYTQTMKDLSSFDKVEHFSTLMIFDTIKEWMIYHRSTMFNIVQHCRSILNIVQHCWSLTHLKNEESIIVQQCSTFFNIVDHWHY